MLHTDQNPAIQRRFPFCQKNALALEIADDPFILPLQGKGSGIGLIFVAAGLTGILFLVVLSQNRKIKELDDTKFDITQSYKDIIQYEIHTAIHSTSFNLIRKQKEVVKVRNNYN